MPLKITRSQVFDKLGEMGYHPTPEQLNAFYQDLVKLVKLKEEERAKRAHMNQRDTNKVGSESNSLHWTINPPTLNLRQRNAVHKEPDVRFVTPRASLQFKINNPRISVNVLRPVNTRIKTDDCLMGEKNSSLTNTLESLESKSWTSSSSSGSTVAQFTFDVPYVNFTTTSSEDENYRDMPVNLSRLSNRLSAVYKPRGSASAPAVMSPSSPSTIALPPVYLLTDTDDQCDFKKVVNKKYSDEKALQEVWDKAVFRESDTGTDPETRVALYEIIPPRPDARKLKALLGQGTYSFCQRTHDPAKHIVMKDLTDGRIRHRSDPIKLHKYYKKQWALQPPPGENNHVELRLQIRSKMQGNVPRMNGKPIDYLGTRVRRRMK